MAGLPPPPGYLHRLLTHNFARGCIPDTFCFYCQRAICSHCCPAHLTAHHHPHAKAAQYPVPRVRVFAGDVPAVSHVGAKGCGYSFNGIARLSYGMDETYIPLFPSPHPPANGRGVCLLPACNRRTLRACTTCSLPCRLFRHWEGSVRGRTNAAALIAANQRFLQVLPQDRYCTHCRRFYSSAVCGIHAACHHPGRGEIIRIVRQDGRVLTRVNGVLPMHVLMGVQVIEVGGEHMVEIVPSDQPLDHLVEGMGMCLANGCARFIGDQFQSCSIRCQARINQWLNAPH